MYVSCRGGGERQIFSFFFFFFEKLLHPTAEAGKSKNLQGGTVDSRPREQLCYNSHPKTFWKQNFFFLGGPQTFFSQGLRLIE